MKKSRRKSSPRKKNAQSQTVESEGRRKTLRLLRSGAVGAVALAGAGVFSVNAVRATIAEQDLSKIGQGVPTIVQIHDPSCSLCTELQRETRKALKAFDTQAVTYLVANIHTEEGGALAARHGVGHVTLLLFDESGKLQDVLEGVRRRDELEGHFAAHLGQAAS